MICQRCAKDKDVIHTCTPSALVRELEALIAALIQEQEVLVKAVERSANISCKEAEK